MARLQIMPALAAVILTAACSHHVVLDFAHSSVGGRYQCSEVRGCQSLQDDDPAVSNPGGFGETLNKIADTEQLSEVTRLKVFPTCDEGVERIAIYVEGVRETYALTSCADVNEGGGVRLSRHHEAESLPGLGHLIVIEGSDAVAMPLPRQCQRRIHQVVVADVGSKRKRRIVVTCDQPSSEPDDDPFGSEEPDATVNTKTPTATAPPEGRD